MTKAPLLAPPRQTAGVSPLRRPGSIRRTSSIGVHWPEGREKPMRLDGRARDVATPMAGGAPVLLAEDAFVAFLNFDRTIVSIESDPPRPELAGLIGERGGGRLRGRLDDVVPDERRNATPLYLILDDISGTSLIAGWAWAAWNSEWLAAARAAMSEQELAKAMANREGVCIGFAPGSSALATRPGENSGMGTRVPDLRNPADPEGWHQFTDQTDVAMRRSRRIDLWCDDLIHVDSAFQDSSSTPEGDRSVIHEYSLALTADPRTQRVLTIEATPRILPFPECPSATLNLTRLLGTPLGEIRESVLTELRGTSGCTHLNDALRALADVPALVERLDAAVVAA